MRFKVVACLPALLLLLTACASVGGKSAALTPLPTRALTAVPSATRPPRWTPTVPGTPTFTATPPPLISAPPDGIPQVTLSITLNYADKQMKVGQQVVFSNAGPDTWDEVVFAVPPAYQPGVFTLHTVTVTTTRQSQQATAILSGTMLHVFTPTPIVPGAAVAVALKYTIAIPPVDLNTWLPLGNLGAGERLIQAGDWHPTLVPYRPGAGWQTWDYTPVGDPNIYGIANYDVMLRADPTLVVAAPGFVTYKGQVRHFRLDRARTFAFLVSPEYQVLRGMAGATPVRVYYLPEYGAAAQAVFKTAAQAIPLYVELYGPYPYTGLVIAQNAYYGAMEYSGLISMSSNAYAAYKETPVAALINLTAHEIAHQWWYGAVGNDQVHEPWLDESFAKYSELLFYERYYPDFVDWWWQHHIYSRNHGGSLDATIYDFADTPSYIEQVYAQGARFLGDLRALMGDPAFFTFIKAYREANDGHIATRDDFFAAVRAHTDADLTPLVERYFGKGSPTPGY
ncbi:MAG TPA: M1 family metallopeptidase [Anaerolineae bacterium]|nr:M1 family metallopeptidase [Anaerolineae bacterium]HQK14193.1 M1 family metallopeptidase [Anaerolineae bacterium]